MKTVILCFKSVLDLCEFLKYTQIQNVEIKVNILIGRISQEVIAVAVNTYHATILDSGRIIEQLN